LKVLVHDYAGHPFQADLSRELALRGHDVRHAYFHGDRGPKGRLALSNSDPEGLSFTGVSLARPYDKASFVRRRFDDVSYGREVAKLVLSEKPDIVISGNTPTEAQSTILKACRKSGPAFVFWVQDFYSIAVSKLLKKKLGAAGAAVGAYYSFLERGQFRKSDAIVVITDSFAGIARKWAGTRDKVFTIENWGTLNEITPRSKDNEWARRYGVDKSFNFLYSGTLGLKHNPGLLTELAKAVKGRANVVAVSQGVGTAYLERAKREQALDNLICYPCSLSPNFPWYLPPRTWPLPRLSRTPGCFRFLQKCSPTFVPDGLSYLPHRPKILPRMWFARAEPDWSSIQTISTSS